MFFIIFIAENESPERVNMLIKRSLMSICPHYPSINLSDYSCLLWHYQDGSFDQSGYEFDHIDEYSITNNNTLENIQALCPMCHSVKTKKFKNNRNFFTSTELANGAGMMDVDKVVKKKRKN